MHGNGNDFMIFQDRVPLILSKKQINQMSNRKTGIGFDQLIIVSTSESSMSDFNIHFRNSDGSFANMCMNGLRCVAKFIWDKKLAPKDNILKLETKKMILKAKSLSNNNVQLIFRAPKFIHVNEDTKKFLKKLKIIDPYFVNVGNKHIITKVNSLEDVDLRELYKEISNYKALRGFNLSIIKGNARNIHVRTWEHGAGETLSCGSASACIGFIYAKPSTKVTILSKGGKIVTELKDEMYLSVPAKTSYEGKWQTS